MATLSPNASNKDLTQTLKSVLDYQGNFLDALFDNNRDDLSNIEPYTLEEIFQDSDKGFDRVFKSTENPFKVLYEKVLDVAEKLHFIKDKNKATPWLVPSTDPFLEPLNDYEVLENHIDNIKESVKKTVSEKLSPLSDRVKAASATLVSLAAPKAAQQDQKILNIPRRQSNLIGAVADVVPGFEPGKTLKASDFAVPSSPGAQKQAGGLLNQGVPVADTVQTLEAGKTLRASVTKNAPLGEAKAFTGQFPSSFKSHEQTQNMNFGMPAFKKPAFQMPDFNFALPDLKVPKLDTEKVKASFQAVKSTAHSLAQNFATKENLTKLAVGAATGLAIKTALVSGIPADALANVQGLELAVPALTAAVGSVAGIGAGYARSKVGKTDFTKKEATLSAISGATGGLLGGAVFEALAAAADAVAPAFESGINSLAGVFETSAPENPDITTAISSPVAELNATGAENTGLDIPENFAETPDITAGLGDIVAKELGGLAEKPYFANLLQEMNNTANPDGQAEAMKELGFIIQNGFHGTAQNYDLATDLFEAAYNSGHDQFGQAAHDYAFNLAHGLGTEQNLDLALDIMKEAQEAGHTLAAEKVSWIENKIAELSHTNPVTPTTKVPSMIEQVAQSTDEQAELKKIVDEFGPKPGEPLEPISAANKAKVLEIIKEMGGPKPDYISTQTQDPSLLSQAWDTKGEAVASTQNPSALQNAAFPYKPKLVA